jgi:hypothetical protein
MRALAIALVLGYMSALWGCATSPPEPKDYVHPTWKWGGTNNTPYYKYYAGVTELDDQGNVDPNGKTAWCYGYPSQDAADACAFGLCSKYGMRVRNCVWNQRGGLSVLAASQEEFRVSAQKARIAGYRETCKSYGFTDESEIATCTMQMDNIIREQIQEGYRRIGELGRDIGNGTLWPTPTTSKPAATPSCVSIGSYVANGFKTCRYSCGGRVSTREVNQTALCPLQP